MGFCYHKGLEDLLSGNLNVDLVNIELYAIIKSLNKLESGASQRNNGLSIGCINFSLGINFQGLGNIVNLFSQIVVKRAVLSLSLSLSFALDFDFIFVV